MEPFLGEIKLMSFVYAPSGWALCNGQPLPINQNQALFSLLGTTYGGDGQTWFALPDLRGRVPMHVGAGHVLGEAAGAEAVALTVAQIPQHTHTLQSVTAANGTAPSGKMLANAAFPLYDRAAPNASLASTAVQPVGGSQPHQNMQPFLTLSYCIALEGVFPLQS